MESAIAFCTGCALTLFLASSFLGDGSELALTQQQLQACEETKQELRTTINGMLMNK